MNPTTDPSRIFTRQQVDELLRASIGKTLLEVDKAQLFVHHEGREKMKGIAGDIVEMSIFMLVPKIRQLNNNFYLYVA